MIVIVQENRTPDNLFGAQTSGHFFESGVNLVTSGKKSGSGNVTFQKEPLDEACDIGHSHSDWATMWDGGLQDGAYAEATNGCSGLTDPMYAYVANDSSTTIHNQIQPYFDIATNYGFANYMFQTNQGPSFPAHLFLFSGTSAPVYNDGDTNQYWKWFAAENPFTSGNVGTGSPTGCLSAAGTYVNQIDPSGSESKGWKPTNPPPSSPDPGWPCYDHNTIDTLLSPASVTWKYYTNDQAGLWTAPAAIYGICGPSGYGGASCTSGKWSNVILETHANGHPAQVMEDISNCNLANVSYVTPDGAWSDHAGSSGTPGLGAFWVADIINLVGSSTTCDSGQGYWNDTVILVTWDDWGGWYDHVNPPSTTGYSGGGTNGQQYVYGFRVPLLVVSAYMTSAGYVSGSWNGVGSAPPSCPTSPSSKYCHDFGSILNFIEYVFGSSGSSLGEIYSTYHYADYFPLDGPNVTSCNSTTCPYALSDFFNFGNSASAFTSISVPSAYGPSFFESYSGSKQDPDDDD